MNFNKVLKGSLAAMMAASLVACSSSSSASTSTSGTTSEAGTFKLGGSGPLTGNASVYGLAVKNAVELAIDEINAEGGVQFELQFEDDQADGEKAVTAFNTLVDGGMQISLGTVTSGAGQAVAPLYAEENIFAITPSGSSTAIVFEDGDEATKPYGNIFQMCFTDPNQGTASADYLKEHTELGTKVGIIYRSDDNYSTGLYNNFVKRAEELGLEIVGDAQSFLKDDTDFSAQVKACKDAGADVVFLPIYYQPAYQILLEADKQGYEPSFFGCDGMDGILTQENVDVSVCNGLYMLTPFSADSSDEKTVSFVKAYEEKYGDTPNQFAADAYDCVYAIKQAIEEGGITSDMDTDAITEALVKEFTSMSFEGITGGGSEITWKSTGEVSKGPKAIQIQDGVYVSVED